MTGRHGARAAFELLQANGYDVERWEQPLSDLAARADAQTVVIFAEPFVTTAEDLKAVHDIVATRRPRPSDRMVGRPPGA